MPPPLRAKGLTSAAALLPEESAVAARPKFAGGATGESGSAQALARLNAAVGELKALAAKPFLHQALEALKLEQPQVAAEAALKALQFDERSGHAWWLLGIARDKSGDLRNALKCYDAAFQLLPEQDELANDLGRLAFRLGMKDIAGELFARFLRAHPDSIDAANNLACALRDQFRHGEAIGLLRGALRENPQSAMLWNTLGTVMSEQGEFETAVTFFTEAVRCDPEMYRAQYNRGNARQSLGDVDGALEDCETAMTRAREPEELAMMRLARSTILMNQSRLDEAWDGYEARLDPRFADVTHFMIDRPAWTPEADLAGRKLLLMGEQGLGDEVLFANLAPDVIEALGPDGHLYLGVEKRLVPLFQRSFPNATVGAHATYKVDGHTVRGAPFVKDQGVLDLWAPLGSPLRRFRRSLDAYPDRRAFLTPDAKRVRHWRKVLDRLGPGPKVGLLWKSLKVETARQRFYSPFEQWEPVLKTPGVVFVNMQYGDCSAEIAEARARFGVEIHQPPGIDLKLDLDDVAALSVALDLLAGPANATSNIAAACGAPVWLISTPGAWPKLGTDRYPWYPSVTVFNPPGYNQWEPVMAEIAAALAQFGTEAATPG
jgi:tetratricopeptide (TPR) repeat protein